MKTSGSHFSSWCYWMHVAIFWWHLLVVTNFLFTFLLAVPFIHTSSLFMWFSLSRVSSLITKYYGRHSWLWIKTLVVEHSLFQSRAFELLTRIRVRHNTKGRVSVREKESSRWWCSSPSSSNRSVAQPEDKNVWVIVARFLSKRRSLLSKDLLARGGPTPVTGL